MSNGKDSKAKYRAIKRNSKRKLNNSEEDKKTVVFICRELLKEIWIQVNEETVSGIITFLTVSGKEIRRTLAYTWFPQGNWKIKLIKNDTPPPLYKSQITSAENVDPISFDRLKKLTKGNEFFLFTYIVKGESDTDKMVECLLVSAIDREIPVLVDYFYPIMKDNQKVGKINEVPLSDDYLKMLANEFVAIVFLMMLEHFAGICIDERLAAGGISRKEYESIIKLESKNPDFTPKLIARVVTQAAYEFAVTFGDKSSEELMCLLLMTETIMYQRKRKNQLAVQNQLEIAKGIIRLKNGSLSEQPGIKKRGESKLLLYDKNGQAIRAFIGYMDTHYRNVDLEKVPHIQVKIGDSAEAEFLRVLEQTFAFPNREIYLFFASVGEFYRYLPDEIYKLYGGEIQKKVIEMLPMAIGFFVVHAVAGALAKRGNPYAIAVIVIAKALGWIMNIDLGLRSIKQLEIAGQHFSMMEKINRKSPKEKSKEQLTKLSLRHLEIGTRALIEAIAEIAAMGIFIAGGKLGSKAAGSIAKYVTKSRSEARIEIHTENDKVTKIRSIKGSNTLEIEALASEGIKSYGKAGSDGRKLKLVDSPPPEEAGINMGRREKSISVFNKKVVKVLEWKSYKTTDPKGRPANSELASGMAEAHLKVAVEVAKDQNVIALFRTTNYRGVQHILEGHPPKGKDLIALNTDNITGKVTAKTSSQFKIATRKGYYILHKDGFAYNPYNSQKILLGFDGKPVQFNMQQKGKFGELTNTPGQVIEPITKKAVVGDYDLQDIILPDSQGRQIALVPEKVSGDVRSPLVSRYIKAFNEKIKALGFKFDMIVHGADAQFLQYRKFRKTAFKGDAIGILPDGRVVYFTEAELAKFYAEIGRSRLDLPSKYTKLEPNKKQ